jgi:hypothetical protein
MNWIECYKEIALTLQKQRQNRECLIDLLADVLYANGIGFPIMSADELFDDIDPFTFMAVLNNRMPNLSKQRLAKSICERLGITLDGEVDFYGAPIIPSYKSRFFSSRQTRQKEIELFWDILDRLIDIDDVSSDTESLLKQITDLVKSLSELSPGGKDKLQWAFYWLFPTRHQALMGALSQGHWPTDEFMASLVHAKTAKLPMVKMEEFDGMVKKYIDDNRQPSYGAIRRCLDISRFNSTFDIKSSDFNKMLVNALGQKSSLLENTNGFHPYTEIVRLSKLEPENIRNMFADLFSPETNLPARVLHFCNSVTLLYERYRDHFARWQARPCAHASFHVASTYLFMYDPSSYYLYSPIRAERLSNAVGYDELFRPTDAYVVEAYAVMCEQMAERLMNAVGMDRHAGFGIKEYTDHVASLRRKLMGQSSCIDSRCHVLLDDIITVCLDI